PLAARIEARPVEPPLVAAEEHVRAGDRSLDRGRRSVADIAADRERLRGDDAPEHALRRVVVVVVERVRVLHPLRPATDVDRPDRLLELAAADGPPDPAVDVARVDLQPLARGL